MIFKYKGEEYEICVRVFITEIREGSDLCELNDDGTIGNTMDLFCELGDPRIEKNIVFYEVSEYSHLGVVDPKSGEELNFITATTLDEIKRRIKLYKDNKKLRR